MAVELLTWDRATYLIRRYGSEEDGLYTISTKSLRTYMYNFDNFRRAHPDIEHVNDVETDEVRRHLQMMLRNGKKYRYTSAYYHSLNYAFTMLFELGYLQHNPIIGALPPRPRLRRARRALLNRKTKSLPNQTLFRILTTIDSSNGVWERRYKERDWLIYVLLYVTGLRCDELASVHVRDVDFENRRMRVVRKGGEVKDVLMTDLLRLPYSYSQYTNITGEEETTNCMICDRGLEPNHTSSICQECLVIWNGMYPDYHIRLRRYIQNRGLEPTDRLFGMKVRNMEYRVEYWGAKVGMEKKDIYPHCIRHTFGTHLGIRNVNAFLIKELMNHQDIKTTQIYVNIDDMDEVTRAMEDIGLF